MSRDMRAFTYGVAAITAVFLGCALVGALVCGIFPSAYRDFHVGDFGAVGAVAMCALAGAGVITVGGLYGVLGWKLVRWIGNEILAVLESRAAERTRELQAIEAELDREIGLP